MKILETVNLLYERCPSCGGNFIYKFGIFGANNIIICPACIIEGKLFVLQSIVNVNAKSENIKGKIIEYINDLIEILSKITNNFTLTSWKERLL